MKRCEPTEVSNPSSADGATVARGRPSEAALRESEVRYRRLFETARDGILILDTDSGKITDVNPYLCELLGYPRADLLGKELWEIGVFEDEAANRAAFERLRRAGYDRHEDLPLKIRDKGQVAVEFVSNVYLAGPAGLQLASSYQPHVMLLDIGLPQMDGFEVARRIRQDPELQEVLLVAMTGYGEEHHQRASSEAGFNEHLVKPVEAKKLLELLARRLIDKLRWLGQSRASWRIWPPGSTAAMPRPR